VLSLANFVTAGAVRLSSGPHRDRMRRDAESLLLHVLGKNSAWLMAHSDESLSDEDEARYSALIERRFRGEPMQYITGECEFYGLPFRVTRDVLIPRPETEHLVEKVLENASRLQQPRIVDVGTGSGAIAVALAHKLPSAIITAIDLSLAALEIARFNAQRLGFADCIRFLHGDLLAPVAEEQFEIIVSNPPYVPNTDRALISVEVREHEPAVALFGGEDGLAIYRRLIPAAHAALVQGGLLMFEFGFSQMDDVESLLKSAGFQNIEFTHDLQGIPRVASAQKS
jgi:release factor glutamine methyltransferase